MIRSWTVGNFKSIHRKRTLELAPLTVVSGENSAGKSALLHSMLAVAQTVSSPWSERRLVLNGDFVRLGTLNDVKHFDGKRQPVELGGDFGPGLDRNIHAHNLVSEFMPNWSNSISFDATFNTPSRSGRKSATDIALVRTTLAYDALLGRFAMTVSSAGKATFIPSLMSKRWTRPGRPFLTQALSAAKGLAKQARLEQFLPSALVVSMNPVRRAIDLMVGNFPEARSFGSDARSRTRLMRIEQELLIDHGIEMDADLSSKFRSEINDALSRANLNLGASSTIAQVIARLRYVANRYRGRAIERQAFSEATELFHNAIEEMYIGVKDLKEDEVIPVPPPVSNAARFIREFFTNNFEYLGPLREEPRTVYEMHLSGGRSLIGTRGEYAAAVIEQRKTEIITNVHPVSGEEIRESLEDALARWLAHFGLGERVETKEIGKLGLELTIVTSDSHRSVDLTNVGVGVSQVLPILVLGLLAPTASTLIFEQPELHLHPRLQALLADFFLGLTKLGIQSIVETHSEHFVNRLLLRIAENDDPIEDGIKIYFARLEQGQTEFEEVKVDKFGTIENWPQGFFDQALLDSSDLIRASVKKRQRSGRLQS